MLSLPEAFQRALAYMSVLSLDLGVLTSLMCVVRLSFYSSLITTTLLLVAVLGTIYFTHALVQWRHRHAHADHPPDQPEVIAKAAKISQSFLFMAIYVSMFAYPVVSVKVVQMFACHVVEDVSYLRADYSIQCYTPSWYAFAAYSLTFLVFYVICFPLFIGSTLWSYRRQLAAQIQGPFQVCKLAPEGLMLGFLLDDYKLQLPCFMWESEEMVRKLSLSVIGAFWAKKSVTCIAAALILSVIFQLLHSLFWPFKSAACNRLQQICLSVLNIVYVCGLLLKTNSVEAADEHDLGVLLVLLLVSAAATVSVGVALEITELLRSLTRTRKLAAVLRHLPQYDPPDDTAEFYNIQIPVEETNMGTDFQKRSPSALAHVSDVSKLAVIQLLTIENEQHIERFFEKLGRDPAIPLQQNKSSSLVTRQGMICAKSSKKTEESILAKANRPSILAKNPSYSIEHVRDTFRFKV